MLGRKSSVIQNHFTKFFVVQLSISVLKEFMLSNLDYLILQVFSSDNLICLVSFKAANTVNSLYISTSSISSRHALRSSAFKSKPIVEATWINSLMSTNPSLSLSKMTKASLQPHHGIPQSPRRGIMQIPDKMSSVWQFWQVSQFYIYSLSLNADYHIVFKDSSNKMAGSPSRGFLGILWHRCVQRCQNC